MKLVKVTTNGRVTIPAKLRKKYSLTTGKKIKFKLEEDGIKIIPLVTSGEVNANVAFLERKGKMLKALMQEKKFECEL